MTPSNARVFPITAATSGADNSLYRMCWLSSGGLRGEEGYNNMRDEGEKEEYKRGGRRGTTTRGMRGRKRSTREGGGGVQQHEG